MDDYLSFCLPLFRKSENETLSGNSIQTYAYWNISYVNRINNQNEEWKLAQLMKTKCSYYLIVKYKRRVVNHTVAFDNPGSIMVMTHEFDKNNSIGLLFLFLLIAFKLY